MECDKKICKMQKKSIRVAVESLKEVNNQDTARRILKSIRNMLSVYDCGTAQYLVKRINLCLNNIKEPILFNHYLNSFETVQLNMIIQEMEEFLEDS